MTPRALFAFLVLTLFAADPGTAQDQSWIKLDVPYVGTPPAVVDAMLALADVGPNDVVYDLGSGDGRILIAAVRDRGVKRAVGIELNPVRIGEAKDNAKAARVADHIEFVEGDIFTADFSAANVVTMYLWDNVNLRLRPRLLNELAPGTRIVSHQFHMFDWSPDRQEMVGGKVPIYVWIVPAQVGGAWRGRVDDADVVANFTQSFQELSGSLSVGDKNFGVRMGRLGGRAVSVEAHGEAQTLSLSASVSGDALTGTLTSNGISRPVELFRTTTP